MAIVQLGLVSRWGKTCIPRRFRAEMGLEEGGAVAFEITMEGGVKVLKVRAVRMGVVKDGGP